MGQQKDENGCNRKSSSHETLVPSPEMKKLGPIRHPKSDCA